MISEFPDFQRVTTAHKPFFDEFNELHPPYADWAFGTLMTWWDIFDDLHAATLNRNIVIASSYMSMGKELRFTILGDTEIDDSIQKVFSFQESKKIPQKLYAVPEHTINAMQQKDDYLLTEELGAAEYVLSTRMHAELTDTTLSKVRRKISRFTHLLEDDTIELTHVPLDTLHAKMLLINALHTWQGLYKNDAERLEGSAIDRALQIAEFIDLQCLCLFINKKLAGFALYKYLPQKNVNVNHIKVSHDYPDTFLYILHMLAVRLNENGIEYMNIEQDLGIEGLRTFKERLRPAKMMRKYNISPK